MDSARIPWFLVAVASIAVVSVAAPAEASHVEDNQRTHRIGHHLTEPGAQKAKVVRGNIRNHVQGVEGWEHIEAPELVVHGLRSTLTRRGSGG